MQQVVERQTPSQKQPEAGSGADRGRNETLLRNLSLLADAVLVNLAFVIAYWLRYSLQLGGEVSEQNYVNLSDYLYVELGITAILVIAFVLSNLYNQPSGTSLLDELSSLVGSTSMGLMLTLAAVFIYQGYTFSRLIFIFTWAFVVLLLTVKRIIARMIAAYLRSRGIGVRRVLVVGSGRVAHMVMHIIGTEAGLGYKLAGFIDEEPNGDIGRFCCLGSIGQVAEIVRREGIDEVIIALPSECHRQVMHITELCTRKRVSFRIVPDLFEMSLSRVDVNNLRGIPLIGIKEVSIRGGNLVAKRVFDIVFAAAVIALLSPVWLIIGLAIKLDSQGPVFFRQTRLRKNGVPFEVYKFRSMKQNAEEEFEKVVEHNEASGPIFKMKEDPRVTRVGKWLRRTSVDEIPQFINVFKGEMSVIGPRPPIPFEVEQYETWHRRRLEAAPGVTGLWQVSGRSQLPFDEMCLLDIYYIENWTLSLDFKILLRTIPAVLTGKGAY